MVNINRFLEQQSPWKYSFDDALWD